ncbi:hypothetical protein Avbf_13724 [Armadillidium vulgare]|nr:hypothetical protein Avbf_13724 [Armadillidium vulgare]
MKIYRSFLSQGRNILIPRK